MRLFSDAGLATESGQDTKVMAVTQTVVNRRSNKPFQSSAPRISVETAEQKSLGDPPVTNYVVTCTIDLLAFTVPAVKFVETENVTRSLEKAEMNQSIKLETEQLWVTGKEVEDES